MDKNVTNAYQEALDYLYGYIDYSLVRNFRNTPEKFDLGRMISFLDLLGNPHRSYPVIHVAGTKGKGSTAALIASALQAGGYKVGLYTSPHLQEFTERVKVNSCQLTQAELVDLVNEMKPAIAQTAQVTWFEITTALGFIHFARQKVDVAVIEVGLGGRLDATNVVDPLVSVITSLSMDHMGILGDTLAKIAYEKAGIIKPGRPVICAPQKPEALQVVEQVAAERGSRLWVVGRDFMYAPGSHALAGQSFQVWRDGESSNGNAKRAHLTMPLLGLHQVENGATAYAALQVTREQGLPVSDDAICRGFARVSWPARFELLRRDPPLIVDSAHNKDSAERLRQALDDYLPGREIVLIFGASDDKDLDGIFTALMPRVREVIATQSTHPRAAGAEKLAALAREHNRPAQAVVPAEQAIEVALERAGQDTVLLATGSLFIAAAVREIWRQRNQQYEVSIDER